MEKRKEHFKNLEPTVPTEELRVTNVYTAYSYYYAPSYVFKGEYHGAWEVYYVNFGEVTVEMESGTYVLSKEQFLIIKPYEFHKLHANDIACSVYVFSFDCDCTEMDVVADKILYASANQISLITNIVSEGMVFLANKHFIPQLAENEKPGFASGQLTKVLLETFLIQTIRALLDTPAVTLKSETLQSEQTILQMATTYMKENVCKKLSLEEIAKNIGYSVSHLCTVFKKNTGTSIIQYFITLRVKKAKQLIAESKLSLKEISEYMEYDSVQYFSAQFKKITGITPSQHAAIIKTNKYINAYYKE